MHNCLEPVRQLLVAFRRDNGRPRSAAPTLPATPGGHPAACSFQRTYGISSVHDARPRADIADISVGARPLSLVD